MTTAPLSPPILLKSGRLIVHHLDGNGVQRAIAATGRWELTEAEWSEYCEKLVQRQRRAGSNPVLRAR